MEQYSLQEIYPDLSNRLFCTFTDPENVDSIIEKVQSHYMVLYAKIFVLSSDNPKELIVTYNVDTGNLSDDALLENTILTHRRKETKTIYTLNGLNKLIESLNGGVADHNFQINWNDYQNCILLTRLGEFARINTKVKRIINLEQ